jgi:hypothetical protein
MILEFSRLGTRLVRLVVSSPVNRTVLLFYFIRLGIAHRGTTQWFKNNNFFPSRLTAEVPVNIVRRPRRTFTRSIRFRVRLRGREHQFDQRQNYD